MANQILSNVENNFTKGYVTEFTGLNFPENAATDCDNTSFSLTGAVTRRLGIDSEVNFQALSASVTGVAFNSFMWTNAGGDGVTQVLAEQIGTTLYFFSVSAATVAAPLSQQQLPLSIDISSFVVSGQVFDATKECEFATGNGYLFVFHPSCEPFYCIYISGFVTANAITIRTRDFAGVDDSLDAGTRPSSLSNQHIYNLTNQGWVQGAAWIANSSPITFAVGSVAFTVQAGLVGVAGGQSVSGTSPVPGASFAGSVTSYVGTTLTINVTTISASGGPPAGAQSWTITPINVGYISTWNAAAGNYPSNSDTWWYYKNASGVFDPATTISNITLGGPSPRGHYVLDTFNQNRSASSGVPGITTVTTTVRPTNGTWFQGRIWYTGVNAQQPATGNAINYSWTENIYFSQIVQTSNDFGKCYQQNDPTAETLFDLLPTDGGLIRIPEAGSIFKLFPIQNGMLVFASNGVWFITGSQGIGFSANDYTITKISSVRSISCTSYVDVNGLPYFWNEEGIYAVQPAKGGGLQVNPITVTTILSYYNSIPKSCKKYVRGAYSPIDYIIQWTYRDNEFNTVDERYQFNKILNYNTYNEAFFPYTVSNTTPYIAGVIYVAGPGGLNTPPPTFKYLEIISTNKFTFADEHDDEYQDWGSSTIPAPFDSYFVTGYKLHGQGIKRFQMGYIYMYSNTTQPTWYSIQGVWDYATDRNSNRYSAAQLIENYNPHAGVKIKRIKIRGQGLVLQIKVTSASGKPFDIIGWSTFENAATGV